MLEQELKRLRRELTRVERGPGRRYPPELKERMVAWGRRAIDRGDSITATARSLGVDPRALTAWLRDAETSASVALVPVEVIEPAISAAGTLALVSPAGYRIEGLTLDDAVAALARLR